MGSRPRGSATSFASNSSQSIGDLKLVVMELLSAADGVMLVVTEERLMPRQRSEKNEVGRSRTEAWRAKRWATGRPESSTVDRAIAAAFAALLEDRLLSHQKTIDFRSVVSGARRILVRQGFDRLETTKELEKRLTRRSDLKSLQRICITNGNG
jgi:hypothetical protein